MKDYRQANRGQAFEDFIGFANRRYREMGLAIVEKQNTHFIPIRDRNGRITNCIVQERSTVDYIGRAGNTPVAIEAKNTKGKNIRFDAVQEHQGAFLTDFCANGEGISLVLVSFSMERFYVVPWAFWRTGRDAWEKAKRRGEKVAEKKTVTFRGQTWTTSGKASVRPDELLPEWEVPMGGRIGLDYLRAFL